MSTLRNRFKTTAATTGGVKVNAAPRNIESRKPIGSSAPESVKKEIKKPQTSKIASNVKEEELNELLEDEMEEEVETPKKVTPKKASPKKVVSPKKVKMEEIIEEDEEENELEFEEEEMENDFEDEIEDDSEDNYTPEDVEEDEIFEETKVEKKVKESPKAKKSATKTTKSAETKKPKPKTEIKDIRSALANKIQSKVAKATEAANKPGKRSQPIAKIDEFAALLIPELTPIIEDIMLKAFFTLNEIKEMRESGVDYSLRLSRKDTTEIYRAIESVILNDVLSKGHSLNFLGRTLSPNPIKGRIYSGVAEKLGVKAATHLDSYKLPHYQVRFSLDLGINGEGQKKLVKQVENLGDGRVYEPETDTTYVLEEEDANFLKEMEKHHELGVLQNKLISNSETKELDEYEDEE